MSVRNLKYLFEPRSVAVIGASEKPHSVGATVLRNLVAGGFGHSRLREWVLGGTTRELLQEARIPVLFSH